MEFTGERQVGKNLSEIEKLHLDRYGYAFNEILWRFGHNQTNVADIGCGIGYGSYILSNLNCNIDAYDISKEAIEFAKQHYQKQNINYYIQDCLDIDFLKNKCYDVIISFEFLEHVYYYQALDLLIEMINKSKLLVTSIPINNKSPFHKFILNKEQIENFYYTAINKTTKNILNKFIQDDKYYIFIIGDIS